MEPREVVLLLWIHPTLLLDFERTLEESPFRVEGLRIGPVPDLKAPIPRCSLYAVESESPRSSTEGLVRRLLSRRADARVLVTAETFTEASAFPLLRIGVKGLLSYSEIRDRLPWALAELSQGGYWVPRELLTKFVETALSVSVPKAPAAADELTERERQVMAILLRNSSNKEIASSLRISERTAKFHVSNVLAKYGVRRRADLILLAYSAQRES